MYIRLYVFLYERLAIYFLNLTYKLPFFCEEDEVQTFSIDDYNLCNLSE